MKALNLVGKQFGRLTVTERLGQREDKRVWWKCNCRCGNITVTITHSLTSGQAKSCKRCNDSIKHAKEYNAWQSMQQRCGNKYNPSFENYGKRGITVCQRWKHEFLDFLEDVGKAPTPQHSLDRIDNNGNYEPGNCKWSTALEQSLNRRDSIINNI